jgi:hypothetical protein
MYQTHPRARLHRFRTRSARRFFRDARYLGGMEGVPSDLSSPRLGERSLKLLDDMWNWGLLKRLWAKSTSFK